MDDCNASAARVLVVRLTCSDSSMDDCNASWPSGRRHTYLVQIPLWTIVTLRRASSHDLDLCSDSSMDDCNDADSDRL